jgi:hypothetical protein
MSKTDLFLEYLSKIALAILVVCLTAIIAMFVVWLISVIYFDILSKGGC